MPDTLALDTTLNKKFYFAKSVIGIGFITAINLMIHTKQTIIKKLLLPQSNYTTTSKKIAITAPWGKP